MVGFTMVEVLVAVLLLAVGLVGALAMQAHAMRTRQESALQTEALQAAATLADRIRANAAQSSAYLGFEFDAAATGAAGAVPGTPAACVGAPCNAAALAQYELENFRRQLVAALPAARAVVCRDALSAPGGLLQWACSGGAGAALVIKIGWRNRRPDGAGTALPAAPSIALAVALADQPPAALPGAPSGAGAAQ
jgi:type IV pilus assembly protein PilV